VIASTRGRLLVASPSLSDGYFDRTVVFMLEHSSEGALGVILNRPTDEDRLSELDNWWEVCSTPQSVFSGGPVEPEALIGLGWLDDAAREGWSDIAHGVGTVDLSTPPVEISPVFRGVRIFRGYAGWASGQLEGEMIANAWITANAEPADMFTSDADTLWRRVLKRQGGRISWMAEFPDDLSAN
jgi:putative transcriptional regulator